MPMVIAAHAAMGSVRQMDVGMQKQGPNYAVDKKDRHCLSLNSRPVKRWPG